MPDPYLQAAFDGQTPQEADPYLKAAQEPTQREAFVRDQMTAALAVAGAHARSDEDVAEHAKTARSAFAAGAKERFPEMTDEQVSKAADAYHEEVKGRMQTAVLNSRFQEHGEYLRTGVLGRRATGEDVAQKLPGGRWLAGMYSAAELKKAAEALKAGNATEEQYALVGQHLARAEYDAGTRRKLGEGPFSQPGAYAQTGWDIAANLPAEVMEWITLTPGARAAGGAAEAGIARAGGGKAAQVVGKYTAAAAARTAFQPQRIGAEALKEMAPPVTVSAGKLDVGEGEKASTAVRHAAINTYLHNLAFEASGTFEPKGGFAVRPIALSTAKAVGANQAAGEGSRYLGGGGPGGVASQLANAKDQKDRNAILGQFGVEVGVFGLLETGMHGFKQEPVNPSEAAKAVGALREELVKSGVPPAAVDLTIAQGLADAAAGKGITPNTQPAKPAPVAPQTAVPPPVQSGAAASALVDNALAGKPVAAPVEVPVKEGPFAHATPDEIQEIGEALLGRKIRTTEGLVKGLKDSGLPPEMIDRLSLEHKKLQDAPKAPETPPAKPAAAPEAPESSRTGDRPAASPEPPGGPIAPPAQAGESRVHITSYKNPSNSVSDALAMLERRGTPPRRMDTWTDEDNGRSQQAKGTAAFVFDRGSWSGEGEARQGIEQLTGAKYPLPYEPSLRRVVYKGDAADASFGKLKESVSKINAERADAELMKQYGHKGALPPVELTAERRGEARAPAGEFEARHKAFAEKFKKALGGDEDVGTLGELFRHLRQNGHGELKVTELQQHLDRMVREGAVEKHTFGPDEDPIYVPKETIDPALLADIEAAKRELQSRSRALEESLRADEHRARLAGREPASVSRDVLGDLSKGGQAAKAAIAGPGEPPAPGAQTAARPSEAAAAVPPERGAAAPARPGGGAAGGDKLRGGAVGRATAVAVPGGKPVPAVYEVRELGSVRASHEVLEGGAFKDRTRAGEYPAGLQPRNYADGGEQQKVLRMASEMVPEYWVSNHPDATNGPPTITHDGTVLNGNGRQMGLERSVHAKTYAKYRQALIDSAHLFGIDPETVKGMSRPALYRVVNLDPAGAEAQAFARSGNVSTTQSQSPARTAASLSGIIDQHLVDALRLSGDTTFSEAVTHPTNGRAFRDRLRAALPPAEEGRYFHPDGRLTDAGTELARNMLLAKFLPVELVERMGEDMKAVKKSLEGALPQLIELRRDYPAADITPPLTEALQFWASHPELRSVGDADNAVAQGDLFRPEGQAAISPEGRMMLDFLLQNGFQPKGFRGKLVRLVEEMTGSNGLFAREYPDTATLAADALGVQKREGASFGRPAATPTEISDAHEEGAKSGVPAATVSQALGAVEAEARREAASGPPPGTAAGRPGVPGPGGGPQPAAPEPGPGAPAPGQPGEPGPGEPGAGQPGAVPRAGSGVLGAGVEKALADFAREAAKEEGHVDLDVLQDRAATLYRSLYNSALNVRDSVGRLGGEMFPSLTRADRESGERLARYVSSATFAKLASADIIDKVMGPDATEADRHLAGAVMVERRLRHMRDYYAGEFQRLGQYYRTIEHDPSVSDEAKQAVIRAMREAERNADNVTSIVGKPGSPLADDAAYAQALNSPQFQGILARYKAHMVPLMEENFRKAEGLDEQDPIDRATQIPGEPLNLKAIGDPADVSDTTVWASGTRGQLRNPKLGRLGFAKQAFGAADAYEADLGKIIENSLARSTSLANKADLYRTMVENGVAFWGRPGLSEPGHVELRDVNPPRGTQDAGPRETSLYVQDGAYGDVRDGLAPDAPTRWPTLAKVNGLLTRAALVSSVEAAYHSKNLLTMFAKPGVNPVNLFRHSYNLLRGDAETRSRLVELARIGALKPEGFGEGGLLWGGRTDPTAYAGKFLGLVDRAMRLTADDAFSSNLRRYEGVEDTETSRRDFINQLGQYNVKAQNGVVRFLRDTGFGPFATAGSNYYVQGVKSLLGGHGLRTTSWRADLGLRVEVMARQASVFAAVGLANFLLWGRVDGDDATPFGSVKVGTSPDGKTQSLGVADWVTGVPRGLRSTGLSAMANGARRGQDPAAARDQAVEDIVNAMLHPAEGPAVAFTHTAITGKDSVGRQVADSPEAGQTKTRQNVKAALLHANPVVGALAGDSQGHETTAGEKANKFLGPYGVQYRAQPELRDYYDALEKAQHGRGEYLKALREGKPPPAFDAAAYHRLNAVNPRMRELNQLSQKAKSEEVKLKIRREQERLARVALGREQAR